MDRYPFEDFVEKPFKYKGQKKEKGLAMDNALSCLLFIYLNSWNAQSVVNKVTATGIWRGAVALALVTYFFTLPTVILCLNLGKFLKHGPLSLHKCSPLLCGVGVLCYVLAFPLGSMMVYYPLAENIIMTWLVDFRASLPPCTILRRDLDFPSDQPCIEEKAKYNCCSHHGVTQTGTVPNVDCMQPRYPFFLLNLAVGSNCKELNSLFKITCDYWLVFFCICMVVILIDIKGIHKMLVFVEKYYTINIYMINLWTLVHLEVVLTGLWYYYWNFTVQEELLTTVFDLIVMEVDHLSMSLPFLLMMGRLIDDSVPIDQLAIKLACCKLVQLFWQANEYIAVISVVATHYKVDYICLHNARRATMISLGVIPEFLSISISRIIKYPAMISYFFSIFLKKVASMVLFGNLLAYHLYFWEKKKAKNVSEKAQVKRSNMKGKFIHTMVKVVVYILLNICQRIFNLKYPMIPALLIGATIILAMQLCLFSIFLLAIYSENRFKSDVEAVTQKKLWPEYLTHLKLQPFISIIFALIRLSQYYIFMDISIERISAKDAGQVPSYRYYKLYPLFYIIPAILISLVYIIFNFMHKLELRIFSVSADWGPVNKEKWKRIKPFRPGRNLVFYDKFYISHHLCFINHSKIRQVSMEQIQNIQHFTMKWPCIFETRKYKHHKEQVDHLVTEAYTWGILASFEESQ